MELTEAFTAFEGYNLWLAVIGLAVLATAILPRLLDKYPLSMPIALLALGFAVVALPLGVDVPHPSQEGVIVEHLTELGVIAALMGAGLRIDRRFSFKGWSSTWRLLGITMVLTIGLVFLIGWSIAAFAPATAMLLGAVIAPTDPVLASEVQVGSPNVEGSEEYEGAQKGEGDQENEGGRKNEDSAEANDEAGELRFALTSEAGLNDGLAFPFTNLAVAMAMAGAHPSNWIEAWLVVDVLYKLGVGVVAGLVLGYLLAKGILSLPAESSLAKSMIGMGALAATLLIYGLTEFIGAYGFLATFIGAVVIRQQEHRHHYHDSLHRLSEKVERLLSALILIAFGGAIASGLLDPIDWTLVLCAVLIVFVVRPLAGVLALVGFKEAPWTERLAISFFGIRGIGSLYYLAYALNKESFAGSDELWALVGLVLLISIFVHGMAASPVTRKIDEIRKDRPDIRAPQPA